MVSRGDAILTNCTVLGNTSTLGGGIFIQSDNETNGSASYSMTWSCSTTACSSKGGGICVGDGPGAGTSLTLQGGTEITENHCSNPDPQLQKGGGIYFGKGTLILDGVWIGSNDAAHGDGLYLANGATESIGPNGVTWFDDQEEVVPP